MSASSRSKPPSRDMTPAPRQGSFDTLGILTEPTDRDKRKVAMVEDSFRRLEQQPRKKKRVSDGITTTEKSSSSSKHKSKNGFRHGGDEIDPTNTISSKRQYVDASTSRCKSGSPDSSVSPHVASMPSAVRSASSVSRHTSSGPPPTYCDVSTQTDAGEDANPTEPEWWFSDIPPTSRPKRRIVSLAKRLLNNRFRVTPATSQVPPVPSLPCSMNVDKSDAKKEEDGTVEAGNPTTSSTGAQSVDEDTKMADAPMPPPAITKTEPVSAEGVDPNLPIKTSPDLRVQLPKVPAFVDGIQPAGATATPLSASSMVQSPFALGNSNPFGSPAVTPSPIKKKMSLSDYTKSRRAARPSISAGTALKTAASTVEELTSTTTSDGAASTDTPAVTDNMADTTDASPSDIAAPGTTTQ